MVFCGLPRHSRKARLADMARIDAERARQERFLKERLPKVRAAHRASRKQPRHLVVWALRKLISPIFVEAMALRANTRDKALVQRADATIKVEGKAKRAREGRARRSATVAARALARGGSGTPGGRRTGDSTQTFRDRRHLIRASVDV